VPAALRRFLAQQAILREVLRQFRLQAILHGVVGLGDDGTVRLVCRIDRVETRQQFFVGRFTDTVVKGGQCVAR
jgi:hypothetical protein